MRTTFADAFAAVGRPEMQRALYRRGYARACDDVAAALRRLDVGSTASEMAEALDAKAEQVRRGGDQ